jgi:OOP family OmpA-OmpF porin
MKYRILYLQFANRPFMKFTLALVFALSSVTLSAQRLTNSSLQLVNIPYDELNPILSPDGKTLYVTVANHPQNRGGKKDLGDIWFSRLNETNQWSALVHGGDQLNDKAFNGVAGFSPDGSEMYLLSHYDASGVARTQGISVSRNNGSGWSTPQNIAIPYFQNKSSLLSGSLSQDGNVFVYSADTYGTKGVDDLYVSIKGNDGKWGEPKNLGSTLNTSFQELSPSISADGKTLYFSSNGRKGNGSFDIYSSTRLDESWSSWSAPVNMGLNVNTEGRELFYRTYPELGLSIFSTTKNSDGYGDVKIYSPNEPIVNDSTAIVVKNTPDTIVKVVEIVREPGADKMVKVYGRVKNAKTGESINARITFSSSVVNQSITSTIVEGYNANVSSTNKYILKVESNGYVSALQNLDINTYEMKELELNLALQPVAIGTTVNMKNVLFEQGKTTLLSESYPELDMVVSFLKSNPKIKIELEGHTDNRGIPAQNVKLSQARVDRVKDYLVSKGINKKRIAGKGYGGADPIASNDNEETRQLNRRVEFTIKKF